MKGIILLVSFLFITAISSLCSLFAEVPNEADSAQYICEISMTDSDYYLYDEKVGTLYRSADKRNAFIGTYEDGLFFDGENAYQYKNNQKTPITEFPFEQYDSFVNEILNTCQTIISKKLYTAYNDERSYYKERSYYFKISKEGLALFRDHTYEYGLISCFYPDRTFQEFSLDLYEDKEARPSLVCTFGTIDYTTSILPATISAVENRPHAEFPNLQTEAVIVQSKKALSGRILLVDHSLLFDTEHIITEPPESSAEYQISYLKNSHILTKFQELP